MDGILAAFSIGSVELFPFEPSVKSLREKMVRLSFFTNRKTQGKRERNTCSYNDEGFTQGSISFEALALLLKWLWIVANNLTCDKFFSHFYY